MMLHYAVVFLTVALIVALSGFGGMAAGPLGVAKVLIVIFATLAATRFGASLRRRA